MTDINNPEKDLLVVFSTNWALTTKGIKKADVQFTQCGFRVDEGLLNTPNIWVERVSFRRLSDVEEFFEYLGKVTVVYWSKEKTASGVAADKDTFWTMVNHVKKLVETDAYNPTGWTHMAVQSTRRIPSDLVPPLLEEEVIVKAYIFWSPT
jgi:hypothetical protein